MMPQELPDSFYADLGAFGNAALCVTSEGEITHVPIEEWFSFDHIIAALCGPWGRA